MFDTPLQYSRPKRVWDGEGSIQSLDTSNLLTVYSDPLVQNGKPALTVKAGEDIRIGDLFKVAHNIFRREA